MLFRIFVWSSNHVWYCFLLFFRSVGVAYIVFCVCNKVPFLKKSRVFKKINMQIDLLSDKGYLLLNFVRNWVQTHIPEAFLDRVNPVLEVLMQLLFEVMMMLIFLETVICVTMIEMNDIDHVLSLLRRLTLRVGGVTFFEGLCTVAILLVLTVVMTYVWWLFGLFLKRLKLSLQWIVDVNR